jgi:hypothetical protein
MTMPVKTVTSSTRNADQMAPLFIPFDFPADPCNRHYDSRRSWLANSLIEPERTSLRQRIGQLLVHLGGKISTSPPDWPPETSGNWA